MSEFELNLIRQRSREAIQQKARRGELQFRLPAGLYLIWPGTFRAGGGVTVISPT